MTHKELVTLLAHNKEEAFSELYFRYKDKLWQYCFRFLKSEEETDDIIQEVFIRIWELRCFIDPEMSFSSFIYTITRNRILNYFRDMNIELQVKKALSLRTIIEKETIESALIFSEYQQILKDAIDKLPAQRKKVFNMSRTENLSHKEIASILGVSVNTIQDHISESLKFIKNYFAHHTDMTLGVLVLAGLY
jgi:RNA polymerase sigma-70 factor (ECF subfamily)